MRHGASNHPPVVLLVEDELLVRMTAIDELEEAGFQLIEAANANVALKVLEARSDEVQVLFTDVPMPAPWKAWNWPDRSMPAGRTSGC
ncbi:hypothetical protein [Microvirga guangxiensis]|uniref:Response regulator receiver domain-containing protein n=1 Tax=Microvirga guangxiensis TaxID=549386 RepID=A0A1G5LJ08_9HYPH|nr:hypothetical protein [Microvirga guangxiensis]SCZ12159.1 Response regulator receiver domain-containing protein [Microvirga guangxiensis]